jgi:hypothetical protein
LKIFVTMSAITQMSKTGKIVPKLCWMKPRKIKNKSIKHACFTGIRKRTAPTDSLKLVEVRETRGHEDCLRESFSAVDEDSAVRGAVEVAKRHIAHAIWCLVVLKIATLKT